MKSPTFNGTVVCMRHFWVAKKRPRESRHPVVRREREREAISRLQVPDHCKVASSSLIMKRQWWHW